MSLITLTSEIMLSWIVNKKSWKIISQTLGKFSLLCVIVIYNYRSITSMAYKRCFWNSMTIMVHKRGFAILTVWNTPQLPLNVTSSAWNKVFWLVTVGFTITYSITTFRYSLRTWKWKVFRCWMCMNYHQWDTADSTRQNGDCVGPTGLRVRSRDLSHREFHCEQL